MSSTTTPRSSLSTTSTTSTLNKPHFNSESFSSESQPSKTKKVWEFVKKHAKEHHRSVNAAYEIYYGQGVVVPRKE